MWKDAMEAASGSLESLRVRSLSRETRRIDGALILSEQQGALDLEHALELLGESFEFKQLGEPTYPDPAEEASAEEEERRKKKTPRKK